MSPEHYAEFRKTSDPILRTSGRKDGQKDRMTDGRMGRQTLIHRTLLAMAQVPKSMIFEYTSALSQ